MGLYIDHFGHGMSEADLVQVKKKSNEARNLFQQQQTAEVDAWAITRCPSFLMEDKETLPVFFFDRNQPIFF